MKKVITILFIVMLFITIIQIRGTFALYKSQITGEYQSLLGVWAVKVNDTDISSGNADMTFEITDEYLHFEESDFVSENFIAPGSQGYFDLLIDATNTDVSIRYDVQLADVESIKIGEDVEELTNHIQIELLSVEHIFEKDGETDTTTEHINSLDVANKIASGVIPLSVIENGYKTRVRVHFKWVNDDNNEMDTMLANVELGKELGYTTGNNEVDTMLINSETQPNIVIPVHLELVQYMGEAITGVITTP